MSSSSECITWFAVLLIGSVAIVTVNLISIILFIKNSNLRTRGMYLVINLTVADMVVGGISSLFGWTRLSCKIVNISLTWEMEAISLLLLFTFPLTSLTNISVISLDRMHATLRPFRHRILEKRVYWVAISAVWGLPAMVLAAFLIVLHFGKELQSPLYYFFMLWETYSCLCLFVICVSYSAIIVKFLFGAHPQHHGAARRQRKLTVTLFVMTVVSLLMWLPFAILMFITSKPDGKPSSFSDSTLARLQFYLGALFCTNSLVNPIVYTIRMPEFRKALLVLLKRQQRQNAAVIPLHAR